MARVEERELIKSHQVVPLTHQRVVWWNATLCLLIPQFIGVGLPLAEINRQNQD